MSLFVTTIEPVNKDKLVKGGCSLVSFQPTLEKTVSYIFIKIKGLHVKVNITLRLKLQFKSYLNATKYGMQSTFSLIYNLMLVLTMIELNFFMVAVMELCSSTAVLAVLEIVLITWGCFYYC